MHSIAYDINFIWKIKIHPDLVTVCGEVFKEIDNVLLLKDETKLDATHLSLATSVCQF